MLDLVEYQKFCKGLMKPFGTNNEAMRYLVPKLMAESGETAGEVIGLISHYPPKFKAEEKLLAEAGDCFWYFNNICTLLDLAVTEPNTGIWKFWPYQNGNPLFSATDLMLKAAGVFNAFEGWTQDWDIPRIQLGLRDYYYSWFTMCGKMGLTLEGVVNGNITKLLARHGGTTFNPEGFANNR